MRRTAGGASGVWTWAVSVRARASGLNGKDLGVLITPPFQVLTGPCWRKQCARSGGDQRGGQSHPRPGPAAVLKWKSFHDINFVNLNYRPFDASNWPLADAGLLGPVTLTPVTDAPPVGAGFPGASGSGIEDDAVEACIPGGRSAVVHIKPLGRWPPRSLL